MDERLLEHYNNELRHLREMAGEFAREFPKIAGRLALDRDAKDVCPDPYVERLLEGFAYLAARVHLKLDSEFPRFTQSLLETVYPHYLASIPSMTIVRFDPEENDDSLAEGIEVERGTLLRGNLGKGERTACTFRTAHPVKLLPLKVSEARYYTRDKAELNLPDSVPCKAAFRIRLETIAEVPFSDINLDPVVFYIRGTDDFPAYVFEQLCAAKAGLILQDPNQRKKNLAALPPECIQRKGLTEEEALLPPSPRSFEGYRLLREYFAFPQRFLFFELSGFKEALVGCEGNQLDLIIALKDVENRLEGRVDETAFELFCTPAINLFPKSLDRINMSDRFSEFHVVADRNRALDFEIFEINEVTAFGSASGEEQEFRPFYLARDTDVDHAAFYTLNRVPRVLTAKEKQFGRKSSYSGTEVYLTLVDATAAPYRSDLRQLGIKAHCTNRHLPIQMATGVGRTDFNLEINVPVASVRCLNGPTLPKPSLAEGRFTWRLISHLTLNYHSLLNSTQGDGASALREILRLYVDPNDRESARQIEGLLSVSNHPIIRRVPTPGPITFARGLEVILDFDEAAFEGTGVFILGSVLEQFLAKYVSLNSFTETVIKTQQRKEIMRWPAQMGKRQIL